MLRLTAFSKKANFIGAIRDNYISNFGPAKWEGLEQKEREKHSLYCIECSRRGSTFPNVTGPGRKKKSRATSTDNNTDTTSNCHSARPIPHKVVVEAARKAFSETNENFAKTFRTPLARVLPKVRELNLTPRKTKNQKQQILRNTQKKIKKAIMSSWQKEGRDMISVYGTRQSLSGHDKQRRLLFMETKKAAEERSKRLKSKTFYYKIPGVGTLYLGGYTF